MKQVLIKSVRVKMPRPLWAGEAKCCFWVCVEGRAHRIIMLGGKMGLPLFTLDEVRDITQLKSWLDKAMAWKQDKNHKEDLAMLQKDPKKWDLANSRPWDRR